MSVLATHGKTYDPGPPSNHDFRFYRGEAKPRIDERLAQAPSKIRRCSGTAERLAKKRNGLVEKRTRGITWVWVREVYVVEHDDAPVHYVAQHAAECRCRVGLVEQDVAAHQRVEPVRRFEFIQIRGLKRDP